LTSPLDFEAQRVHNLTIVASDLGKPKPQLNTLNIRVIVLDQNDNPPVYDRQTLPRSVDIKLDSISNSTVLIGDYLATDRDAPGNQNISYRITGQWQRRVKNTARPIVDNDRLLERFNDTGLFQYNKENGSLNANVFALNQTTVFSNFYVIELEAFDPQEQVS